MKKNDAIIFGYNEYARQIATSIRDEYHRVRLYAQTPEEVEIAQEKGFDAALFDLGDEWDDIDDEYAVGALLVFCALEDDAENIFLTISLRAAFSDVTIIALAKNQESASKLKIAGANKVMPILQTTANVITEILEKPIVTDVLHDILYEESTLQIAQVSVGSGGSVVGKKLHDVQWHEKHGVIILAVVDSELDTSFIFTTKGHNHSIKEDDLLVVIGYEEDIHCFEKNAKGES